MSFYPRKKTPGDTSWFIHDRFGMIIHFGLYSLPARHEWLKSRECISEEKYQSYFRRFNPNLLDAREWARKAKAAGMKYAILTTKHHEGFCLFDTKYTDYNVMNTPYGKDIVREYVDAFRAEGLKIGFYYSLIDWHHPDFPIDKAHPRRKDANAAELDRGRDMKKYAQYMRDQVTELLTNYGKIDILYFDFSYPANPNAAEWMQFGGAKGKEQWESEKLIALIRSLAPDIIINDRTQIPQDTSTPEQSVTPEMMELRDGETGEYLTWEACHTFSGSWGYYRDETSWKTPKTLIDLLVRTVSAGGNMIMNVGPTSRGCFDARADEALAVYADWMKYNSCSIYGCDRADPAFGAEAGVYLTQSADGERLYVHLLDCPHATVKLTGLEGRIDYAQLLADGSELTWREDMAYYDATGKYLGTYLTLNLPGTVFSMIDPVIEIFLK